MKSAALAAGCGTFAFILLGFQMGMFSPAEPRPKDDSPPPPIVDKKPPVPFPEALSPACKGQPVHEAADIDPKAEKTSYRFVFLKAAGGLHSWHDNLKSEWQAETVEETQLVIVLGPQRKTLLSVQHYPNGAPSVSRYKFEMEASLVAAKAGRVLAQKRFVSMPRPVAQVESWELTAIEQPVAFSTVYNWAASQALVAATRESNTPQNSP